MSMDEDWSSNEIITAIKSNSLAIRVGSTAAINAIVDTNIAVGNAFFDTDIGAWKILTKIDGVTRYFTVFGNQLYHSDVIVGFNTGVFELGRKISYSSNDLVGYGNYVLIVVNYESYAVNGEIKVTVGGNATSVIDTLPVVNDPGVKKEAIFVIDTTSTKDDQGSDIFIELKDAKMHLLEIKTV